MSQGNGRRRQVALAAALVVALCAPAACYHPPPIPLDARPADLDALLGEWSGDYLADGPSPRGGRITFLLAAGDDHAHGDVVMIPTGAGRGLGPYRGSGEPFFAERGRAPQPPETLTIHFVHVANGAVTGVLDPYWDPERQTQVRTTFHGRIRGNVIDGTYSSILARPAAEVTGTWRVTRRPAR